MGDDPFSALPDHGKREKLFGGLIGFQQAVSDAGLCENKLWLGGILLNFAADVCHIDPKNLVVGFHVRSPDFLHDGIVCDYAAGIPGKQRNNAVFVLREMYVLTAYKNLVLVEINVEITGLELFALGERALHGSVRMPKRGADSGQKL